MKKLITVSALLVAFATNAHIESAESYRFEGDLNYSTFCKAVVTDDVAMFKRSVASKIGVLAYSRKGVVKKLISENGITCNGIDLVEFSKQREASEVYAFLTNES